MATRRVLTFANLDAVVADAKWLLAHGYDRAGNWDLAQVCGHTANFLTYPLDGYPKAPLPVRMILSVVRLTLGRKMREQYLNKGIPPGKPTFQESVPAEGGNEVEAVMNFQHAANRFDEHKGEVYPSPLFGTMTKAEALEIQLAHCAHHFSFLVPKTATAANS